MPNIAASVKNLTQIKDVTPDDAKRIRAAWRAETWAELFAISADTMHYVNSCYNRPGFRVAKRYAVNCILRTHGVEFLGIHKRNGEDVYYCNAGDSYTTTIVFIGARMYVRDYAYYVEKNLILDVQ